MDPQSIEFFRGHIYEHGWLIPAVAIVLYVVSAVYVGFNREERDGTNKVRHKTLSVVCILCWAVGPPLFLLLEYVWIGCCKQGNLPNVEAFKYSQELASKFWVVALAILVFLYAGKIPGG